MSSMSQRIPVSPSNHPTLAISGYNKRCDRYVGRSMKRGVVGGLEEQWIASLHEEVFAIAPRPVGEGDVPKTLLHRDLWS